MPTWEEAINNDSGIISEVLSDTGGLLSDLPGELSQDIKNFGVDAYNTLNSIKFAWEATPDEINSAKKIYRVKDILNFPNNIRAISLDEIEDAIDNFANSYLAKTNDRIKSYVDKTKQTISALQVSNKLIESYRVVKPLVKKAVNIGGLVWNFANTGEIAQDVLQLILREVQRKYKEEIDKYWINFVSSPVFIVLGGDDDEAVEAVLEKYIEIEEAYREKINDYLLSLMSDIEEFIKLVRKLNDFIVNSETEFYIKDFTPIANSVINDVCEFDDWTYLSIKEKKIIRVKEEVEEDLLTNINAINILKTSNNLYFTTYNETLDETYLHEISDPFTTICTLSGLSKAIYEAYDKILIVTNKEIADSQTSFFTYSSNEISSCNIINEYLYFSIGNILFYFDSLPSTVTEVTSTNGTITSIVEYNGTIYLGSVFNGDLEISSFTLQPEFLSALSDLKEFTLLKEINSVLYGARNKKLYTLEKDSSTHEITSTLLCENIESEINGLEILNISGEDYYVIASGATLLVSDSTLKNWDEKIIDFEEIGLETAVITDIKYKLNDGLYLSSYKNLIKIPYSSFAELIPTTITPTVLTLDGEYTEVSEIPEKLEIEEEINPITISLVSTYDYLIYKIHSLDPIIISAGKYIYSGSTVLFESDRSMYLSIVDGENYYYSKGNKLWLNNTPLVSIKTDNTLLSAIIYDNKMLLFTDSEYFISSGNSSFNYYIPKSISIRGDVCLLESSEEALLICNGANLYQYNGSELGIYEYIQKIINIIFIKKTGNSIYIQDDKNKVYTSFKENTIYKDSEYHNAYKHNLFYSKKLGIAPFDYCSRVLTNIIIQKRDYIGILKPDFKSYFKQLVTLLPKFIADNIIEELQTVQISSLSTIPSQTQNNILNTIKREVQDKVISLLKQVMSETFSIGINQEEEFSEILYNRLLEQGRNNITKEFYGIAFKSVSSLIRDTFNIFNNIDLLGLVILYYNRHKEELSSNMIRELKERFVPLSDYKFSLDYVRGVELDCYREQNFLLNYYVKEDIENIISGKEGSITISDKLSLESLLTSRDNIVIENMPNYLEWETQIKDVVNNIYKPTQQIYFEEAIEEQNMEPIQWQELPEDIEKDEFIRLLNMIIDNRKEMILIAINTLIGTGSVPCYSCITDQSALLEVKNKINSILLLMKASAQKKIKKSINYEDVPSSFTVYDSFGAYVYLPKVLERQSNIYSDYLSQLIDLIINEDEELV